MERVTLETLRALARDRIGLVVDADRLRITAGRGAKRTAAHRGMVAERKLDLISVIEPESLRSALGLPADLAVSPTMAVAFAWAVGEREAFTEEQQEQYAERAGIREYEAGAPRWLAELLAIEDVLTLRAGGARHSAAQAA